MIFDVSLANRELYAGLNVQVLAGKPVLTNPPAQAIPVLIQNLARIAIDPEEVVLTGAMAIWAHLVVFLFLHGKTKRIYYEDGRGQRVLVAAHG